MTKKANDQNKVIVERVIDEELPPGWVKEIRTKKTSNGVRRDPFYNDTTTGYVFRSRLDVFRYLETGEISKHAYKRKAGGINDIQSMQVTASAATVRSNDNKGKETLQGSLLPNHGNSKVMETSTDTPSVENNALSDLGADVDVNPIEPQKPEGNENDVVRMDSDTKVSKSKEKRNDEEKSSSRRSSNRLAGIDTEFVTHPVAIERALRAANKKSTKNETMQSSEANQAAQSQQVPQTNNAVSQEDTVHHCTEPFTVPSTNEIVGAGQIKINEQSGVSGSKRKPERNRKKMVLPRQNSNLLPEIDVKPVAKPVTPSIPTKRVLRSARSSSTKTEQIEQVKDATPGVNVGSEEDIICQYTESASTPVKNESLGAQRIEENEECGNRRSQSRERKPKRSRTEIVSPASHATKRVLRSGSDKSAITEDMPSLGSEQDKSAKTEDMPSLGSEQDKSAKTKDMPSLGSEQDKNGETPPVINSQEIVLAISILPENHAAKETSRSNKTDQAVEPSVNNVEVEMFKETPRNNVEVERSKEAPRRNNVEVERMKETPRRNNVEVERMKETPRRNNVEVERITRTPTRNNVEVERIKETPRRNNVEVERIMGTPTRNNVEVERIKETPRRNSVEVERMKETPKRNNVEAERIKETPTRNNVEAERIKETPTRNNVESERMKETPTRNNVEVERIKETPKYNSKNLLVTDEVTAVIDSNGKEKEQQEAQFSFPWSDPCIEFAYKTLTGALPLDDTLAIHDYVQHQIRTSSHTTKNFTQSDCRPSGFPLSTVPSNSSTSITFPDPGPPGFSRAPLVDALPPGFSLNDIPSDHSSDLILPDSGPPGFSRGNVHLNNGNNLASPVGMPPGFSRSSLTPCSSNNFTVPDARPPQFSWSSVPPNSGNNPVLPDAKPPGFPWSTTRNSVTNPAVPEAKPPSSTWGSVPPNNPAAKPAGPPGFPWSSISSNISNNSALPDAKPPGFSWSSIPPSSGIGINLNVALPDSGPPGFSQKINPPAKQQHQQQTNPAGIGTQPADFPFEGTMFTWNQRN